MVVWKKIRKVKISVNLLTPVVGKTNKNLQAWISSGSRVQAEKTNNRGSGQNPSSVSSDQGSQWVHWRRRALRDQKVGTTPFTEPSLHSTARAHSPPANPTAPSLPIRPRPAPGMLGPRGVARARQLSAPCVSGLAGLGGMVPSWRQCR